MITGNVKHSTGNEKESVRIDGSVPRSDNTTSTSCDIFPLTAGYCPGGSGHSLHRTVYRPSLGRPSTAAISHPRHDGRTDGRTDCAPPSPPTACSLVDRTLTPASLPPVSRPTGFAFRRRRPAASTAPRR